MNISGTAVGWPEGSLGIGVPIFVIALFPISIYLQKKRVCIFCKIFIFIWVHVYQSCE